MFTMTKKRNTALGKRLTAIRKTLGLTQAQAADKVGVSMRAWVAWELGTRKPTKSHLILIGQLADGKL